ncbi:hypothetical protein M378DRAFT_173050 [Amanita muscaria Koide BX008]|uniref:Uncharacterized protein n=1 Tax=Amanita muscaria (strain Koide BX008) TaxID=946122 RepID=A0A0C2S086_AMAMK|nr:hypothetical protein M378DRAFT_173050 [Amanita muscaria Koide BX008]
MPSGAADSESCLISIGGMRCSQLQPSTLLRNEMCVHELENRLNSMAAVGLCLSLLGSEGAEDNYGGQLVGDWY